MKHSKLLLSLLAVAITPPVYSLGVEGKQGPKIPVTPEYRDSVVLYQLDPDATPAELKRFNALINPSTLLDFENFPGVVSIATVKNIKGFEKAYAEQLQASGAVLFAEPDAAISHSLAPIDSSQYNEQWHHQTINSEQAWDNITSVDPLNVKVCVLDTGVDTDHVELAPNLLLPGYNAELKLDGNVEDAHGHGTGTAGVIGAVGNNGIGIAGVAWDVGILPIQINISDQDSRAYISTMAVGIRYCADQGGKVANLSYGGAQYPTIDSAAAYLRNSGGLLFMSAGNDGNDYPTSVFPDYTSFVVVGATNQNDERASFSQAGPYVDITAPGVSIFTTYLNNTLTYYSGTSFSSPMTAGVAALLYGLNPGFTPDEVENYLFMTAGDIGDVGDDAVFGHGLLNSGAAVDVAYSDINAQSQNTVPIAIASAGMLSGYAPLEVSFSSDGSYDPDGEIIDYQWDFGDGLGSGASASHTYTEAGEYNVSLRVTDNRYAVSESDVIVIRVDNDPNVVQAPTNLQGVADGTTALLSWDHNAVETTTFEVHRGAKSRGQVTYAPIDSIEGSSNYADPNLDGGNYIYKVRAKSSSGSTEFTNSVQVTIDKNAVSEPSPELYTPILSSDIDQSTGLVTLSWTDTCGGTANCSYRIERGDTKTKGSVNFEFFANGTGLNFAFYEAAGTYYYRVFMEVNGERSPESNTVSVRVR